MTRGCSATPSRVDLEFRLDVVQLPHPSYSTGTLLHPDASYNRDLQKRLPSLKRASPKRFTVHSIFGSINVAWFQGCSEVAQLSSSVSVCLSRSLVAPSFVCLHFCVRPATSLSPCRARRNHPAANRALPECVTLSQVGCHLTTPEPWLLGLSGSLHSQHCSC